MRVSAALQRVGFARVPNGGSPDFFFLSYDEVGDCWLWLHVTWEISFGLTLRLKTRLEEQCLARRVRTDGVWQLQGEDAFWVTLLHVVLDKSSVSTPQGRRLLNLIGSGRPAGPVAQYVERTSTPGWDTGRVLAVVRAEQWDDLGAFGSALTREWRRQSWVGQATNQLRRLARLAVQLDNPWRRRGLSVALLGPDGSGKSTLAAGIVGSFFFPATSIYMNVRAERLARAARTRVPGLAFLTYLTLLWFSLVTARYRQARGALVVFDRYPYDALTASGTDASLKDRAARWIVINTFPNAGMALVLDVPGDLMHARKGERDPEDLEAERQRLLQVKSRLPHVVLLDGALPPDAVRRAAISAIWQRYVARWNS
jgi:thymidylate kinase